MCYTLRVGFRWVIAVWCGLVVLVVAAPVVAEVKPLTKEEQAKIDAAIDKGVAFLKKAQTKQGDFVGKYVDDGRYLVGQCALPAYALLESGVPVDDPVIQRAAAYLRPLIPLTDTTYELPLAILFLDRLGDPKDKKLIQGCALRLIAGQHRSGGWAYHCPVLSEENAAALLKALSQLKNGMKGRELTRGRAMAKMEIPPALQILTVFQNANSLPWQEPGPVGSAITDYRSRVALDGRTDNSNTQFALLGLWAARRHDVAVDPVLDIAVEHFEQSHAYPGGYWLYDTDREFGVTSRNSMTCAGLIGLAIGRALKAPTPGLPAHGDKDVHILRGLAALSRQIGKPTGDMNKRVDREELYFLWSLERVAMLFNLPDIGGKDWYRWGAEGLVTHQRRDGWWADARLEKRVPKVMYQPTINTSFALLFLKRSHPMKDLTAKLPFTAKELNGGIARLRIGDRYPVRTVSESPSQASSGGQP